MLSYVNKNALMYVGYTKREKKKSSEFLSVHIQSQKHKLKTKKCLFLKWKKKQRGHHVLHSSLKKTSRHRVATLHVFAKLVFIKKDFFSVGEKKNLFFLHPSPFLLSFVWEAKLLSDMKTGSHTKRKFLTLVLTVFLRLFLFHRTICFVFPCLLRIWNDALFSSFLSGFIAWHARWTSFFHIAFLLRPVASLAPFFLFGNCAMKKASPMCCPKARTPRGT
jgi:hypothetical protein